MTNLLRFYFYSLFLIITFSSFAADSPKRPSTASANVHILPHKLVIPGLERERTIRLYLPPNYDSTAQSFPVLYMHDAQNLFDDATSYAGEWKVDEILNQLTEQGTMSLIVVGIDNGEDKRMNELSPWPNENFGEAEGKAYTDFIVKTLKPYIDANYRTLKDAEHTAIMGSSMGGLISHYAIFQYPEVFSKAGIFSPSYWYADDVFHFTEQHPLTNGHRLYMIVSNNEGDTMTGKLTEMETLLVKQNHKALFAKIHGYGNHNEAYWSGEFEKAIKWLFQIE
ncbi:MAG: alpha/beta hydrolase [Aestuariibacter sp.]